MDARLNPPVIVGAGPVGAVCALALAQQGITARVLEAQPETVRGDSRTLALSHGSQLILAWLGVWDALAEVTPITRIHISQRGAFGVARLSADEVGVPALGYVLSYATLAAALKQALSDAGVAVEYGVAVERIAPDSSLASLHTTRGEVTTPLAVVADGGRGSFAPTPKYQHDYAQQAVVCDVQTELPHAQQAYERFTPDGPAALLPKGDHYALVWTADNADAERIAAMDDNAFLAALYQHFGGRQGRFLAASPRKTFPLSLAYTGCEAAARVVRIGNAAQTLHPVAGQGFNIGLRDAWELAALCGESPEALGSDAMLTAYARGRRADVIGGLGFTDFLVRTFSNDLLPIRHARGLGLFALEALPSLKTFVARRMMFGARG
ncbi:MAG: FAD-dependent monooxygenase [Thiobacillus sp.]